MSKADQIRTLMTLHLPDRVIAKRVGVGAAYVRAVRQRTSASGNPIKAPADLKWRASNREAYNAYHRVYQRAWVARKRAA